MNSLEYFVGKICTVFTVPSNRDFKSENPQTYPQPLFHYFVGKVLEVSQRGVWVEQWNTEKKLRTFFFMDHIVSISEEEQLDPSNPNDMKIIDEFKKTNESSIRGANERVEELKKQRAESPFVDLDALSGMAEKAKG